MQNKFYITTPIYYVNDIPHIGHAYTTIATDVLARFKAKEIGPENVFFLTGTDEHGAKIAEAAAKQGKTPQVFVDELSPKFQQAWDKLNIGYSEFFRTTNKDHSREVQNLVQLLIDKGFVEKRQYQGLYCVGCERYYAENELVENCCPDHKKPLIKQSEENYFFLLSKLQSALLEKIQSGEFKIEPEARRNEIIGKIKQGLEDVSISRAAVEWGIPFPGDDKQTIYVWIDALLNYYTASKIYHRENFWPADIHLMAKDILWFHAVIWPCVLMAAEISLPKRLFAHGFFTINNQKMSKTLGNVLDPNILVDKFGADTLRYALLCEFPFGEDGDISEEKIANHYRNDLANGLGNLLQRTIAMINRYQVKPIIGQGEKIEIEKDIMTMNFKGALSKIWQVVSAANSLIDEKKPWELAKNNSADLEKVLSQIYNMIFSVSDALEPFMPETAQKIKNQLEALQPEPLFPRID